MILSDIEIGRLSTKKPLIFGRRDWKPMVEPYSPTLCSRDTYGKIISYGQSSYGYDLRVGYKFKVFSNAVSTILDPKNIDSRIMTDIEVKEKGEYILIPPMSFALGYALEKLNMPDDVTGIVVGKSTLARSGINCIATPAEAGWSGHLTLEFANTSPVAVKLYAGEGACQILFFRGDRCRTTYKDRKGKYMDQPADIILPRI